MKRIIALIASALCALVSFAQGTANTAWPYLYPEFMPGTLTYFDGKATSEKLNVHLAKGMVHYTDDQGVIREAPVARLKMAEIGNAEFIYSQEGLLKVILYKEGGYIGAKSIADFSSINETGGGYGVSSATSSTQRVSGMATNGVNTSVMELLLHKDEGSKVAIKTTYYLVVDSTCIKADKKDVTDFIPAAKQQAFKDFLKKNKINWKDLEDLEKVLDFILE